MTAPVPYESRVRPLIAAATPAPWVAYDYPDCITTFVEGVNTGNGYDGEMKVEDARLIVALRSTAAASADLAEAVRAYKDATDRREAYEAEFREMWEADKPHHSHKVAALLTVETNAYRAMLAALSRLDSAASSAGGA